MSAFQSNFEAAGFAEAWIEAWNGRDVEAVLAHFAADAVFTSPVAQAIGFAQDGIIRGKTALRRYWTAALARNSDLRFELTRVFQGIDTVVIAYRNQNGEDRVEVLTFDEGLVVRGSGMFATA